MKLRESKPMPGLDEFVESVWVLEGPSDGHEWHRIFPDGSIDIVFGFGDRVLRQVATGYAFQPRANVIGHMSQPLLLKPTGIWRTAGVRLRPEGAFAVLNMNLAELADSCVPLEAVWGRSGKQIVEQLLDVQAPEEALRLFQGFLLKRVATTRRPHPGTVRAVREILKHRGLVSVHHLAQTVGWSERTLERRFAQEVGLSPKLLSQTARFHCLLACVSPERKEKWASLAWDCGFADQAHLAREVQRFAGSSPMKLFDKELALARMLLSPERLRGCLPQIDKS
jgi:AraC-like DNA-binding protein